jgi:hypothetical protein
MKGEVCVADVTQSHSDLARYCIKVAQLAPMHSCKKQVTELHYSPTGCFSLRGIHERR